MMHACLAPRSKVLHRTFSSFSRVLLAGVHILQSCVGANHGIWKILPRRQPIAIFGTIAIAVALLLLAIALTSSLLTSFLGSLAHSEGSSLRIVVDVSAITLFLFCWTPRVRVQTQLSQPALAESTECHSPRPNDAASRRRRVLNNRRIELRQGFKQLRDVVTSLGDGISSDLELGLTSCVPYRARIHDYHEVPTADLLLPVEVVACNFPLDVSEHLQRLLEDRWVVADSSFLYGGLPSIPE
jgi:hypothetical protein